MKTLFLLAALLAIIPQQGKADFEEPLGVCSCTLDTLSSKERKKLNEIGYESSGFENIGFLFCREKKPLSEWASICGATFKKEIANFPSPYKKLIGGCDVECLQ